MRLSVIDQCPISAGSTPTQALEASVALAQLTDRLGYHRYWIAEHHATGSLASPAPEILIARLGAETKRIRVGSGGIMLPHYSAFKVTEQFRMLHAMYPNRIDLGVGRAPGGTPLDAFALRRERSDRPMPDDFSEQLSELLAFLHHEFPTTHPFNRIKVSPEIPGTPEVWLLGSSMWSAAASAQFGLPYAFAHFFSGEGTRDAIEYYHQNFKASPYLEKPQAMAAIGVICADTDAEADRLMMSVRLMSRRIRQGDFRPIESPENALRELGATPRSPSSGDRTEWPRYLHGTPEKVRERLEQFASALRLEEVLVVTITHDYAARLRSYELLAQAFNLNAQ